jgi:hypothetical protein
VLGGGGYLRVCEKGSAASRKPSPTKVNASTAAMTNSAGTKIQGACSIERMF